MTIPISELLQKSFVLSVSSTRYHTFCERFTKYGLNTPLPRLYKGFELKNGVYNKIGLIKTNNICNCNISHVCLIKVIQSLGWDYVCIFEDDALPCKDILSKLEYYLKDIPDNIDLLKLGHIEFWDRHNTTSKYIQQQTLGSHAYIIFKQYYEEFTRLFLKEQRIDRLCMNANNRNIFSTNELLFIQDDRSFADNLHGNQSYLENMKNNGELLNFDIINT